MAHQHVSGSGITPIIPVDAHLRFRWIECVKQTDPSYYTDLNRDTRVLHQDVYLWPALVWINKATAEVGVVTPPVDDARVVLLKDVSPGSATPIPPSIGELTFRMGDGVGNYVLILAVTLWEQDDLDRGAPIASDTPLDAVEAGFQAYASALQQAITRNLLSLADPDQQTQATKDIETEVRKEVEAAIEGNLNWWQKFAIGVLGDRTDSEIADSNTIFQGSTLADQTFGITLSSENNADLFFASATLDLVRYEPARL